MHAYITNFNNEKNGVNRGYPLLYNIESTTGTHTKVLARYGYDLVTLFVEQG